MAFVVSSRPPGWYASEIEFLMCLIDDYFSMKELADETSLTVLAAAQMRRGKKLD